MHLIRLGYWLGAREPGWPDPNGFVDPSWDDDERAEIVLHLRQGIAARPIWATPNADSAVRGWELSSCPMASTSGRMGWHIICRRTRSDYPRNLSITYRACGRNLRMRRSMIRGGASVRPDRLAPACTPPLRTSERDAITKGEAWLVASIVAAWAHFGHTLV